MSNTTGPVDFTVFNLPPDSDGAILVNLNIALIAISAVILSLRLYVRGFMIKSLGLDDLVSSLAFVGFNLRSAP